MEIQKFNKRFHAVKEMTEQEYQVLLSAGRIFTTKVRLYGFQAEKVIGPHAEGYPYSEDAGTYCGTLVTENSEDFEEAGRIAASRGWGEEIDLNLCGIVPAEKEADIKEHLN